MASYYRFPYVVEDNIAIYFGNRPVPLNNAEDLLIYYPPIDTNNWISCRCSRWDVDNWQIIIETWLNKSDLKEIRDNITPGAVSELYTVLGKPFYYDKTWTADNTLKLVPNPSSSSELVKTRRDVVFYPKSIVSSPIKGDSGWMNVKIEGYISGGQVL